MPVLLVKLTMLLLGLLLTADSSLTEVLPVAAFLTALSLTSLNGYVRSRHFVLISSLSYFGVCVFVPAFCPYLPLVCFDLSASKPRWTVSFAAVPLLAEVSRHAYYETGLLFILVLLALLMRYICDRLARLSEENIKIKDSSREQSRLLTQQNKLLLEKQDYEIHLATLSERNRIAREIHDNVGHILSRSILQTGALEALNKDSELAPLLSGLKETLSFAMDSIRGSVHGLKDESVDLHETLRQMLAPGIYETRLDYDASGTVPNEVKYCFITTLKEALTNISKHSDATKIRVTVAEHPALYQLLIRDNGTKKPPRITDGMGLSNMEERVQALGGQFRAEYSDGFRIFISIPRREEAI